MRGYVIGKSSVREVWIVSQEQTFRRAEYLIIEDEQNGDLPLEVIQTFVFPMISESVLPEECSIDFFKQLEIDVNKRVYLAKAKILMVLDEPVIPMSKLREPTFKEIEPLLIHADVENGFHIGVIQGTETIHEKMPEELKNVAPLWSNKKAVKQNGVPFLFDYHTFREYPHIGLFGTSGSGKTFGLRVWCEEFMKHNIPALAFDPHNELNFDKTMDGIEDDIVETFKERYVTYSIGKEIGIPFSDLKLDELHYLFEFVGELTEPQKSALEVLYEKGMTLALLKQEIVDLKTAFEEMEKPKREQNVLTPDQVMLYERHKNRVSGSKTLQALSWKLDALESTNIFVGDITRITEGLMEGKLVVVRGDMRRLQMISAYVVRKLYKKRRAWQDSSNDCAEYFPMFFLIFDEAHNFAPKNINSPTKKILRTIAQEARKYGVFELFCTQKPDGLDEVILAQLNTKIIYRLNTAGDMELVRKETNLTDEETKRLPDLPSGHCFVSSATLPKTFAVRFRTTFSKSPHTVDPFDEFKEYMAKNVNKLEEVLLKHLPIKVSKIKDIHGDINRDLGKSVTVHEIIDELEKMARKGRVKKKGGMGLFEFMLN